MVTPFQLITQQMVELGFFDFLLPWIITAAIFWGLFKKSSLFESSILNAVISLALSFFVWGFTFAVGVGLGFSLSIFITQIFVFLLVFIFAMVGASIFYPKFPEMMKELFQRRTMIWILIAIAFLLFIVSGLINVIFMGSTLGTTTQTTEGGEVQQVNIEAQQDINSIILVLVGLIVIFFILAGAKRYGAGGGM